MTNLRPWQIDVKVRRAGGNEIDILRRGKCDSVHAYTLAKDYERVRRMGSIIYATLMK